MSGAVSGDAERILCPHRSREQKIIALIDNREGASASCATSVDGRRRLGAYRRRSAARVGHRSLGWRPGPDDDAESVVAYANGGDLGAGAVCVDLMDPALS